MDRYVVAITWLRAGKIYWSHAWRAFLIALALGFAAGVLLGLMGPLFRGLPRVGLFLAGAALFMALVLYAGSWGMRRALQLRYGDFAIEVLPVDPAAPAGSLTTATLTQLHALAVTWAMFWRGWLIAFPLNLVAAFLIKGTVLPTGTVGALDWILVAVEMVIALATGTWALRIALTLHYGTWRLQLVPAEPAPLAAPTFSLDRSSPQ